MIARHYGRSYTMETLRRKSGINREGVSPLVISEAVERIGFRTIGVKLTWGQLKKRGLISLHRIWGPGPFCGGL